VLLVGVVHGSGKIRNGGVVAPTFGLVISRRGPRRPATAVRTASYHYGVLPQCLFATLL